MNQLQRVLVNAIGLSVDSREVKPGYVFVAIKGVVQDGHDYIDLAIHNGAKFIVHEDDIPQHVAGVTYLKVADARIALSQIAAILYPKQPKYIMGVTGTSGKSSTVHFVREIIHLLKKKAVSIGTMGVLGDLDIASSLTTPPTEKLHQILQEIAENNIDYLAMECSSHGLQQHRLDSVKFTACAFTNLSQDHLDYHHTMAEYFAVKKKLFELMDPAFVVLNHDIKEFAELKEVCRKHRLICYGKDIAQEAEHNIVIVSIIKTGVKQQVYWQIDGKEYETLVNLVGEFQISNLACAIGLLLAVGIDVDRIMQVLPQLNTVTGRMELVATHNNASIFVDYAHKPDALLHALQTLKQATSGRLWLVFGCGGDRDKEKRIIMGEIASRIADKIVVTDDNPRNEDPASIRREILRGCPQAFEITERGEAIAFAISQLEPGDNLIIAGKGHENYQIIGDKKLAFSDVESVRSNL